MSLLDPISGEVLPNFSANYALEYLIGYGGLF